MRWTFDTDGDALYVYLTDGSPAGQVPMPDGTVVDVDEAGRPVGVEVLRPWAAWDIAAVVERFQLDDDTRDGLRWITGLPLITAVGVSRSSSTPMQVHFEGSANVTATQAAHGLVPA